MAQLLSFDQSVSHGFNLGLCSLSLDVVCDSLESCANMASSPLDIFLLMELGMFIRMNSIRKGRQAQKSSDQSRHNRCAAPNRPHFCDVVEKSVAEFVQTTRISNSQKEVCKAKIPQPTASKSKERNHLPFPPSSFLLISPSTPKNLHLHSKQIVFQPWPPSSRNAPFPTDAPRAKHFPVSSRCLRARPVLHPCKCRIPPNQTFMLARKHPRLEFHRLQLRPGSTTR